MQGKKKRLRKKQAARLAKQNGDVPVAEKNARSEAEEKAERRARKKREKRERRKLRKLGEAPAGEAISPAVAEGHEGKREDSKDRGVASATENKKPGRREKKKRKKERRQQEEARQIGGVSVSRLASYGTDVVKKAKKQSKRRRRAK